MMRYTAAAAEQSTSAAAARVVGAVPRIVRARRSRRDACSRRPLHIPALRVHSEAASQMMTPPPRAESSQCREETSGPSCSGCREFAGMLLSVAQELGLHGSEAIVSGGWLHNGAKALRHSCFSVRFVRRLLDNRRTRGILMLNMLVLLYSTNWSIVKTLDEQMDPSLFAALRFGVAALPFARWLPEAFDDSEVVLGGLEVGLWSFLGYQTQALGLELTDASKCAFLSTFTVLAVPVVGSLHGRSIKMRTLVAAGGAFAGVGLLEQGSGGGGGGFGSGDAWALLSALLFGVQIFRIEFHTRRLPKSSEMPLMSLVLAVVAALSCGEAALKAFPAAAVAGAAAGQQQQQLQLLGGWASLLHNTQGGAHHLPLIALLGSVLYVGLATTALTLYLEMAALRDVEASDCAVIYSLEPLLGAGIAWVTLGERWGPAGWAGVALIIASTLSAQLGGGDDEDASAAAATDEQQQKGQQVK